MKKEEMVVALARMGYLVSSKKNKNLLKVRDYYNKMSKPMSIYEMACALNVHWITLHKKLISLGIPIIKTKGVQLVLPKNLQDSNR